MSVEHQSERFSVTSANHEKKESGDRSQARYWNFNVEDVKRTFLISKNASVTLMHRADTST